MHDELVKLIWECASGECFNCSQYTETTNASVCSKELMKQAADAIVELSREAEVNAKRAMKWAFDAEEAEAKLRWIPVTERLPEKMQYVLVRYQNNDMAVASWFGGDEHIRFWRAMTDEGWCADCDTEPTHWMPLPQPPKEE